MSRISGQLRNQVRERAHQRLEYCRKPEGVNTFNHTVDHIRPERHLGTDEFVNLAWSCFRCNNAKKTDIASYDEATGELTLLFNPREHHWQEHFDMNEAYLIGTTAVGRVTVRILNMNQAIQVNTRRGLMEQGLWG